MEDMSKLKDFILKKIEGCNFDCPLYVEEFSVDDLKELRYLASLALVEALCKEHGNIMKDILKGVGENDKA